MPAFSHEIAAPFRNRAPCDVQFRGSLPSVASLQASGPQHGTPRRQDVRAWGILDSYRREKGILVGDPAEQQAKVVPPPKPKVAEGAHPAAPLLDLEADDEVHFTDDDTPCPVDCVIEVFEPQELQDILDSVGPSTLVVVDFYKTACGACKYIMPGFVRLCKQWSSDHDSSSDVEIDLGSTTASSSTDVGGSTSSTISSVGRSSAEGGGSSTAASSSSGESAEAGSSSSSSSSSSNDGGGELVVFVKHNVYDDEEELVTDLARQFVIKSVPMFKFFKGGQEVDGFATRDKKRLVAALQKHTGGAFGQ